MLDVFWIQVLILILLGGMQKWSKGKQKEKVNNMVLFDQATYDKLLSEAPKFKLITPSILSDRLRVRSYIVPPPPLLDLFTGYYSIYKI